MKTVLRYDESGVSHDAFATVDAVEAALAKLDNVTCTSIVVEIEAPDTGQTLLSIHGHVDGPLVCCWIRMTADGPDFERWLLGQSAAADKIGVRVWGVDTKLRARFAVSAEAVRLRVRSLLAGEDLEQHGPWEDML